MSKKLFLFLLGITVAIFILIHPIFQLALESLGNFGYLGSFLAGIFYTSIFTSLPASAGFILLGNDNLHPLLLAWWGGLGAMLGDYLIYKLFRSNGIDGIKKAYIFKSRLIRLAAAIIGFFIIASPFPDEIGIALLGITNLDIKKFLPISFILNSFGILALVGLGKIL